MQVKEPDEGGSGLTTDALIVVAASGSRLELGLIGNGELTGTPQTTKAKAKTRPDPITIIDVLLRENLSI